MKLVIKSISRSVCVRVSGGWPFSECQACRPLLGARGVAAQSEGEVEGKDSPPLLLLHLCSPPSLLDIIYFIRIRV